MNAQPTPAERVRLTDEQLARLEAATVRRHSRTFTDRDGITRTTQAARSEFIDSLVEFYRARGYLTTKQVARVSHILEAQK